MSKVTNYTGEEIVVDCLSCYVVKAGDKNPGSIFRSQYFDIHQEFEIPIPGMIMLTSVRHIKSVDEFTKEEQEDFVNLLVKTRKGLRKVLNIQTVYLIQEEDTSAHFHMWLFPRYPWMQEKYGTKIQSVEPIISYAKKELKTKENIKTVEEEIKQLRSYFA